MSASKTPRRRPWGRILSVTLLVGLVIGGLVLWFAHSALMRRARNEGLEISSLGWSQLSASTANRAIPGGLGRLHAIGVTARWSPLPLQIDIDHLQYQAPKHRLNQPVSNQKSSQRPQEIAKDPRPRARSIPTKARTWLDEQDWTINIKHGPSILVAPEHKLSVRDITIKKRASNIDLKARVMLPNGESAPLRCQPQGILSWDLAHLRCEAPEVFDSAFELDLERIDRRSEIRLRQGEHAIAIVRDSKKNTWHLETQKLPALWWEVASNVFSMPTLPFLRTAPKAELSVKLDLSAPRRPHQLRELTLHSMQVHGLVIDEARLSPNPVPLPVIQAQGTMQIGLRRRETGQGKLDLTIGELKFEAEWERNENKHRFALTFPSQPCMHWLNSVPSSMRPALEGLTLEGQSPGTFVLQYDPKKTGDYKEDQPDSLPGKLVFEFPFFEQCKVTKEPTLLTNNGVQSSSYKHTWPTQVPPLPARIMGRNDKSFVSLNAMPLFSKAITVTEDPNFWDHKGFDTKALQNALWYNLASQRIARGASTISQQCARMLWLGTQRNLTRKLQEIVLTWRLEATTSKRRILELYLNLIELGPKIHGGPDAARYYFGRSITSLNLKENIFLATLAPAPARKAQESQAGKISSSWNDNLLAQIERLRIRGWITTQEAQDAVIAPLDLKKRGEKPAPR